MPEEHLDLCFGEIMGTNEDQESRKRLAGVLHLYTSHNLLKDHWEDQYSCVNDVADKDGRPIDEIRILTWRLINNLCREEPSVTLTTRDQSNRFDARDNRDKDNAGELPLKICGSTKKVDKEIRRIVSVYAEKPNEGEEE